MMITGIGISRSLSARLSWSPLIPGMWRSETTTSNRSGWSARKLVADENASAPTPNDRNRPASEPRTRSSSSTIAIRAFAANGFSSSSSVQCVITGGASERRLRLARAAFERFHHPYDLRQRTRAHLAHRAPSMELDGDLAELKVAGDLLVEKPGCHQLKDLALAVGQFAEALAQRYELIFALLEAPVLGKGTGD